MAIICRALKAERRPAKTDRRQFRIGAFGAPSAEISANHSRPKQPTKGDPVVMIAAAQSDKASSHVMGIAKFERFFRMAAGLDVDKQDLKRYSEFVNHKVYDLLLRAQALAKANGRIIIEPFDLPITKGLQENIHAFRSLNEEIEIKSILDHLTARPPLDLAYSDDVESSLAEVAGGLSVALANAFKVIDPDVKNPQSEQWERCLRIFNLLV
jgi:hypothetical protein